MRARHVVVFVCAWSACGTPAAPPTQSDSETQVAALAALDLESGTPWRVRWYADVNTPALLEGRSISPIVDSSGDVGVATVRAAQAFVTAHAALFRMGSAEEELSLDDTGDRSGRDELGMMHLRFHQQLAGLPVWGHELKLHFAPDGRLYRIDGRYAPVSEPATTTPTVTTDDAVHEALWSAAPGALATTATAKTPTLLIDPIAGVEMPSRMTGRLAWRVEVVVDDAAAPSRSGVYVDALSGEPYRSEALLATLAGTGTGVFGDPQTIGVTQHGLRYYLEDGDVGDPAQKVYVAGGGTRLPGTIVSSDRPDRWDETVVGRGAAVDAQAFMAVAHGYFARVHGRQGALGDGAGMRATVHFGQGYAAAFWNGSQLVFGDGDGALFAPLAGALDVVAHEFTHAVIESAAHLGSSGERGALAEAISDVFACFVEQDARDAGNWSVGDEVSLTRGVRTYRDVADPYASGNPARTSEMILTSDDSGGVHVNSTVASHAAYLMTEGGRDPVSGTQLEGLGRAAVEAIWYRTLARYLGPSSDFRDAADATVAAARDLYGAGSVAERQTTLAWQAVGVLPPD